MALEIRIKKRLHEFLLDVAFTAGDGVTALLGASGSGKSMTLRCIAGVERPDEGYIALDGRVLFDSARGIDLPPQRRRVGYLFQSYALFPTMTVAENIAAGVRRGRRERRRIVEETLEAFQLTGVAGELPHQLSGGQQQRVALARILASEPETILLDEPLSALDSHLKWQLEQELMERLAGFPGAKILVSHDRDEVYRNCAQVCVIDAGRTEPIVGTRELFAHPRTVRAALLSGCKNNLPMRPLPDGRVLLPDWGLTLVSVERAAASHRYAGLRAHHLHPAEPGGVNAFPCRICRVTENVFSVILILSVDGAAPDAPQLRMELDRTAYSALPARDAITVQIAPEDVLLLQ